MIEVLGWMAVAYFAVGVLVMLGLLIGAILHDGFWVTVTNKETYLVLGFALILWPALFAIIIFELELF